MKNFYLWNDLPLFLNLKNFGLESKLLNFFNENSNDRFRYILVKNEYFDKWLYKIKNSNIKNAITIGTRPDNLKLSSVICNIKPKRIFSNYGLTKGVEIISQDVDTFKNILKDKNNINFIEDVSITGKTISRICSYFRSSNLNFHLFCINEITAKRLKKNFSITINADLLLEGEPIIDSTLVCLYDLIFGYLGDRPYKKRVDLFLNFFDKDCLDAFFNIIDEIKSNIDTVI